VNSLELSSDDQPMKGQPGSSLRANRRTLPLPGGAIADPAAAGAVPVVVVAVDAPPVVDPPLVVGAVVAADAVVGVFELLLPHAANNVAMAGALNPSATARFNTWRRVKTPEIA
jgi:hypothetical protein